MSQIFSNNLLLLITLGSSLPSLLLGVLAFYRGRGSKKTLFLLSTIGITAWSLANYFSLVSSAPLQIQFVRSVMFAAVLMTSFFYLFIRSLTNSKLFAVNIRTIIFNILIVLTLLATATPLVFISISFRGGQPIPDPGPLVPLFGLTILLLIGSSIYILARGIKSAEGESRSQLIYVATGYATMFVLLFITQFLLTVVFQNTELIKFGPLFTLPFVFLASYAIVRHHLFDVKVIAAEIFTAILVSFFFINTVNSGPDQILFNIILLVLVIGFGYLLVRSVIEEINKREEIERLNRQLADFLRFGVHELRAPLGGIRGYSSMILEGSYGQLDNKLKRVVKIIHTQIDHLLLLVETFLDANRARTGNLEVVLENSDVRPIIKRTLEAQATAADLKGLELKQELPEELPKVRIDPRKFEVVLGNLISNAIKYTQRGSVEITAKTHDGHVSIQVKDTGIGIPKEVIPTLFTTFERGTNQAKKMATGSGIGLYLSKKLTDAMHGTIEIESPGIDKGTTATVLVSTSATAAVE